MNVLAMMQKELNVDPDRIYLMGHSMGGAGALHLAVKYPDKWATVAAIALGLEEYDPARIHLSRIPAADVHRIAEELLAMPRAERAAIPVMHPGRVDVIGAGALVWSTVVQRVRAEVAAAGGELRTVVTSEHDILDGIAWSAANRVASHP